MIKKSGQYGHIRAKEDYPMRDINWGISFDITINGKEASFSDLTESEQKKIFTKKIFSMVWTIKNLCVPNYAN